jgi:uncharacterized membrane protein YidH (DUF202 family)
MTPQPSGALRQQVEDMVILTIEVALAFLVLIGATTIVWGARRFHRSSRILAVAFALTAASWIAFLIATISITLLALVPRISG